jgi:hypothetical protein
MEKAEYVKRHQAIPIPKDVLEMQSRFGSNKENKLTEWEKNDIKDLFREYDKNKSGALELDELKDLMKDIMNDKGLLGKVPTLTEREVS